MLIIYFLQKIWKPHEGRRMAVVLVDEGILPRQALHLRQQILINPEMKVFAPFP